MRHDIEAKYGFPKELMPFVDDGFLEILSEKEEEKTIEFHIPCKRSADTQGRITTYSLVWIHPDFNKQFCHYYDEHPGDLANFYVTRDTTDLGDEQIAGLESLSDLIDWLHLFQQNGVA